MRIRNQSTESDEDGEERDGMQESSVWQCYGWVAWSASEDEDKETRKKTDGESGEPGCCPWRIVVLPSTAGNVSWVRK